MLPHCAHFLLVASAMPSSLQEVQVEIWYLLVECSTTRLSTSSSRTIIGVVTDQAPDFRAFSQDPSPMSHAGAAVGVIDGLSRC